MDANDLHPEVRSQTQEDAAVLRAKLNTETAQIAWTGVQRFFAQGRAIHVRPGANLLDVAVAIACNDAGALQAWIDEGQVEPVTDAQALEWFEADALMWSVVVKPWVLVQAVIAEAR